MIVHEPGFLANQGLPALAAAPIPPPQMPTPPSSDRQSSEGAGSSRRSDDTPGSKRPRSLRVGDKVRSLVDDVCVSVGLTGIVVNVASPRYGASARARVLWDNETTSMADVTTFTIITGDEAQREAETS